MEALGIDIKLILFQAANFLILMAVLKKFLYKPILGVLEKRQKEAEDAIALKGELETKIGEIRAEREQVLLETRSEADKLMETARQKGERIAQQIEEGAKERAGQIVQRGEETASQKESDMREKLRSEVARIAVTTAEQVVGKSLDEQSRKELTEESVRRFVENG
jgi:F-type H+-transporting ATPase subunit b